MSQNTSHAVMAQRHEPADSMDLFPTPLWATRALCEHLKAADRNLHAKNVWEPACGLGHMARALSEYFSIVRSSDAFDYGHGEVRDFLFPGDDPVCEWIITNPPFRLAEQFAHAMIDRASVGCAILVRTTFLEGVGRWNTLFSKRPPTTILQFTERVPMHKGRVEENGSTATAYCWIVWEKGAPDAPAMGWIPPCRKKLERPGDYEPVTRWLHRDGDAA